MELLSATSFHFRPPVMASFYGGLLERWWFLVIHLKNQQESSEKYEIKAKENPVTLKAQGDKLRHVERGRVERREKMENDS